MELEQHAHITIKSEEVLKIKKVCIFASSCDYLEKTYYTEASKIGNLLGQNGFDMVYGGSKLGLMWACAGSLKEAGGKLYGVMPEKLNDFGVSANICDEFFLTCGMRERKAKMDELSDAVIALPGGFGTLEEVAELIVQKQLGYNKKPIVILNTNGFYDKLNDFFEEVIEQKFANKNVRSLYYIANTPQDAIDYLKTYKPSELNVDKNAIYAR